MIAEVLLVTTLTSCAAGAIYLKTYSEKEKNRIAKEKRNLKRQFRSALTSELRQSKVSTFSYQEFVDRCCIDQDDAAEVAKEIYSRLCDRVVEDGEISDDERKSMKKLSQALMLDENSTSIAEKDAIARRYRSEVEKTVADGEVSPEEEDALSSLRKSLGLTTKEGFDLSKDISSKTYIDSIKSVVRSGMISEAERVEFARMKRALSIRDVDACKFLQDAALEFYRECFAMAAQDGMFSKAEKDTLAWLESESGLTSDQVKPYHEEMERIEKLRGYREGNLAVTHTRKMLEGGELCHWEGGCRYSYRTRNSNLIADGNLLVTSKRVVFTSPNKTLSFAPAKILDIQLYRDAIELTLETRNGTGVYFVRDTEVLEAILVGLARKHKYLLSESFSSNRTRHIPDQVKREVWSRDQGRCVRCAAIDYLEFDHIIPHGKGGSNSVANVQILCRRCNLQKSDRV